MTQEDMIKILDDVLYNLNEIRQDYRSTTRKEAVSLAEEGYWRLRVLYDELVKEQGGSS